MEYKVAKGWDSNDLEHEVNTLINKGFRPIGDMVVYFAPENSADRKDLYLQPMIKENEWLTPIPQKVV